MLSRVQLFQLDSVNVAVRAHYVPLFARLGPYDRGLLDEAAWSPSARKPRLLCEYWAHEASLVPIEDWPLLRSGAKRRGWWAGYRDVVDSSPGLVEDVLAVVRERGPLGAGSIERAVAGTATRARAGSWWDRSEVKKICEWLFGVGELTTGARQGFERLYDLTERVVPAEVLARTVDDRQAARELIERAATALGVATETDLRDYYRLRPEASRDALAELVEHGTLEPVRVAGWRQQAYRHHAAWTPRRLEGRALLCPFDPLIWERSRTERLFDFRYRIEIYLPEHKRQYGYYVFPFLLDGALVARVDLKSDHAAGILRVQAAFAEPGVHSSRVARELADELRAMARWLELDDVAVAQRGDLAASLATCLR